MTRRSTRNGSMNNDWSCIAEVTDYRDELVDIQQSLQDQKSPSEN